MEKVRVSKLMSEQGICSRREADHYIERGWVLVDGVPVTELGTRVFPNQKITLSEKARNAQSEAVTILLNKPIGLVSGQAEKEYLVRVEGRLSREDLARLNHGLELDGKVLRPAKVDWLNRDQLRFILNEGRKRQIRRMCEMVGLRVTGLKRVRIGGVRLGELPEGRWRYLRSDERF